VTTSLTAIVSGWINSDIVGDDRVFFLKYNDLLEDPLSQILRITNWAELDITATEISDALEAANKGYTRKNKAQIGRGRLILSEAQQKKIEKIASHHFPEHELLQSVL
jgi:hypothetical protein